MKLLLIIREVFLLLEKNGLNTSPLHRKKNAPAFLYMTFASDDSSLYCAFI